MTDLLQHGVVNGLGREPGVEATPAVPPATLQALHVEVQPCVMYEWNTGNAGCVQPAIAGSKFCAEHSDVKLCKASGLQYRSGGNSDCWLLWVETMQDHPIGYYPYTKRAQFCGDRCRNLWRDTKQSRERQAEVRKLENGERSERYNIITNYRDSGEAVIVDKKTGRIVG